MQRNQKFLKVIVNLIQIKALSLKFVQRFGGAGLKSMFVNLSPSRTKKLERNCYVLL